MTFVYAATLPTMKCNHKILEIFLCNEVLGRHLSSGNMYVKAPLRVMYGKYSTRGGVEWQIQHRAKPSAVFAT